MVGLDVLDPLHQPFAVSLAQEDRRLDLFSLVAFARLELGFELGNLLLLVVSSNETIGSLLPFDARRADESVCSKPRDRDNSSMCLGSAS